MTNYTKGDVKLFVIKLLLNFVLIGEIWNIYDIVCAALGKYKLKPTKINMFKKILTLFKVFLYPKNRQNL